MKRLKASSYSLIILVLILATYTTGCKPVDKKNNNSSKSENTLSKKTIEKEVHDLVYPLPTTFELTSMLNGIGADYILGLSNSPDNADKYFTEKARALNLGVYSADLSYASTYHRKQETMLFLKASKKIIDNLEITSAFNETLISDVEKNLDKKDELINVITNSFYETYAFLNKNGKANLSLFIVSGSFIEGLYIATNISENTFSNPEMVKIIFDQKDSLERLLKVLQLEANDSDVASLITDLSELKTSYDKVNGSMTKAQLDEIIEKVSQLREKIIK